MAKKKSKAKQTRNDEVSFEEALAEVEEIVSKLESGEADLTESLQIYERGVNQLKRCHQLLHGAERKVTLLSGFDANGNAVTPDFDHDAAESLETKRGKRSDKRSGVGDHNAANKGDEDNTEGSVDEFPGLF